MAETQHPDAWTPHQRGALITLVIIAVWSAAAVWLRACTHRNTVNSQAWIINTVARSAAKSICLVGLPIAPSGAPQVSLRG
jgi:hypothetical protein